MIETILLVVAAWAVLASLSTLGESVVLWRRVRRAGSQLPGPFAPPVAVFVPCKGLDPDLPQALGHLLAQDYPAYEVVFTFEAADDPAVALVRQALAAAPRNSGRTRAELVFAGPADGCGQKVHNLRAALRQASPHVEAFAFMDSDMKPRAQWLRHLVAPLAEDGVGATTGYRWYFPVRGGLPSMLLSTWNSAALYLMINKRLAFAWGGSMAMRRSRLEGLGVERRWSGSLSDDCGVSAAAASGGLRVRFVPQCLVESMADMTWGQLVEFVFRQYTIVRVYRTGQWVMGLVYFSLFTAAYLAGPAWALAQPAASRLLLVAPAAMWGLSMGSGALRLAAGAAAFPARRAELRRTAPAQILSLPVAVVLVLAAHVRAGLSRRITWRGITYDMRGPNQLVVLRRPPR